MKCFKTRHLVGQMKRAMSIYWLEKFEENYYLNSHNLGFDFFILHYKVRIKYCRVSIGIESLYIRMFTSIHPFSFRLLCVTAMATESWLQAQFIFISVLLCWSAMELMYR